MSAPVEKPFLYTDLIPPDEVASYVPDEQEGDVIPIRTWSRGDPFNFEDGTNIPVHDADVSADELFSNDGMLNYTSIEQAFEDQENLVDKTAVDGNENGEGGDSNGDSEYEGEFEEDDDGGNYEQDDFGGNVSGGIDGDNDGDDDDDDDDDDDGYLPSYDQNTTQQQPLEADDLVNLGDVVGDEEEEDDDDNADNDLMHEIEAVEGEQEELDMNTFEKVALSPRELDMIAASGPTEDYNDLVNIMNEYNELVTYLESPRAQKQQGGASHTKAAAKMKTISNSNNNDSASGNAKGIKKKIIQQSASSSAIAIDADGDDKTGSDKDEDDHAILQQNLLQERNKKSIAAAAIGGVSKKKKKKVVAKSKAQLPGHSTVAHNVEESYGFKDPDADEDNAPSNNDNNYLYVGGAAGAAAGKKKQTDRQKKKLFGQAKIDQENLAIKQKQVGRETRVDRRNKAYLAGMVESRKKEEQQMMEEVERVQARRKKFKEALLEKALRARQVQLEEEEQMCSAADGTTNAAAAAAAMNSRHNTNVSNSSPARVSNKKSKSHSSKSSNKLMGQDVEDEGEECDDELEEGVDGAAVPKRVRKKSGKVKTSAAGTTAGGHVGANAGFLAPTKAFQVQSITKTVQDVQLSEEEVARREQEKRDHIAAVRRKFKEQHKKILNALKLKKQEEEKRVEEEQQREILRKEKHKQKLLKLLAEKPDKQSSMPVVESADDTHTGAATGSSSSGGGGGGGGGSGGKPRRLPKSAQELSSGRRVRHEVSDSESEQFTSAAGTATGTGTGTAAAGGGLAAIRRRSRSLSQPTNPTSMTATTGTPPPNNNVRDRLEEVKETVDILDDAEENDAALKQQRKQASKEQQAKMSSYLSNLAEQRKQEELEKKKKEERNKKRANLLKARLMQEAAERKLMLAQDERYAEQVAAAVAAESAAAATAAANKLVVVVKPTRATAAATAHSSKNGEDAAVNGATNTTNTTSSSSSSSEKPAAAKRSQSNSSSSSTSSSNSAAAADTEKSTAGNYTGGLTKSKSKRVDNGNSEVSSSVELDKENFVSNVPARDFDDWKRKNNVPPDGKVFAMTGWYPCVKDALLQRGWYQNTDVSSPYYHLKWTLRSLDVAQETLQPWQLTNHYLKNVAITTKAGLIKCLNALVWTADAHANDIIPRGYDLGNTGELQAFIDDFRCQKAEGVLKSLYHRVTGLLAPPAGIAVHELNQKEGAQLLSKQVEGDHKSDAEEDAPDSKSPKQLNSTPTSTGSSKQGGDGDEEDALSAAAAEYVEPQTPPVQSGVDLASIRVNSAVFDAICSVLEKEIRPYDDDYIDDADAHTEKLITDLEWEIIATEALEVLVTGGLSVDVPEPIDGFLREKEDPDAKPTVQQQREKRRQQKLEEDLRAEANERIQELRSLTVEDVDRIHHILCSLSHHDSYQTGINGRGPHSNNMWIVKPAAKSRGRGISTFTDLPKLLKYVDAGSHRFGGSQWVVQKYIENPLTIAKRKFDLRQWVVVTNWNPLTIYFYDECYTRFGVEEYSTEKEDLSNSYIHLVNNSITKNSENFSKGFIAENGEKVEGFMWSYDQFSDYVKYRSGGEDVMKNKIHPRMQDIAKWSLMCGAESIEHRKNSWELYGFDFMVDEDFNAWLIEINSSPACDYSTSVTERYVQKALVELLTVVLDTREWEAQPKKTRGPAPETGGWVKIHQGPHLDKPIGSFGTEMTLRGEQCKNLPPRPSQQQLAFQQMDFSAKLSSGGSVKAAATGETRSTGIRSSLRASSEQMPTGTTTTTTTTTASSSSSQSPKRPGASQQSQQHLVPSAPSQASKAVGSRSTNSSSSGRIQHYQPPSSVKGDVNKDSNRGDGGVIAGKLSFVQQEEDGDHVNGFNDSDDDSCSSPKRNISTRNETVSAEGPPLVANPLSRGNSSNNSRQQQQTTTTTIGPPAVASIPIKMFSVDF